MANLRVNKITSTETFETTGSVQFDGANSGLTISDNTDFDLGTGDFTIEGWYYIENVGVYLSLFDWRGSGGDGNYPALFRNNTGNYIYYYVNSTVRITNVNIDYNTWFHVTVCRSSGITRLFLNGKEKGSFVDNTNYISRDILLGLSQSSSNDLKGHISNYRVIKGKALYTSNFTPPTRELTVTPETVLLACQHKTDASHEKTGKTITVNGNAVANELTPGLLTDVVKSGGSSAITGSVEFDGTGDYLSVTPGNDFTFGTNSFTIEMFVYKGSRTGTHILYDHRNTTGAQGLHPTLYYSGSNLHYYVNGSNIITTSNYTQNNWRHYALVRSTSTNTVKLYINGIQVASASDTNDYVAPQSGAPYIGQNPGGSFYFDGFISNLRIVKGTALYTQNFIPPTRELKKLPGTVLLCCQDENSVTTEATGKTITSNGDPAASNFTPQVGNDGSVEFVGPTKINTENYFYLPTGNTEDRGRGRGVFGHGASPSTPTTINTLSYIDIQSSGIAQDFGDLTNSKLVSGSTASSVRGLWGGGYSNTNVINYITISTTSNAQDFGDLTQARHWVQAGGNNTRGIFCGGNYGGSPAAHSNVIDYVTIMSTGNAIDFGDLTQGRYSLSALSNAHGGL